MSIELISFRGSCISNKTENDDKWQKRISRIRANRVRLYHETSEENANKILQSGRMYRGQTGWAGAGIYFATTAEATHAKSRSKGIVLSADVLLGKEKHVNGTETDLGKTNFHLLHNEGFDSICIDMARSGKEYVVYNYDQVETIQRITAVHQDPATSQFKSIFKPNTTKYQYICLRFGMLTFTCFFIQHSNRLTYSIDKSYTIIIFV